MTKLFQKNFLHLAKIIICCLCLAGLTVAVSQDNGETKDKTTETTVESTSETNTEASTEAVDETSEDNSEDMTEEETSEETTKTEEAVQETTEDSTETESSNSNEETTPDEATSEETNTAPTTEVTSEDSENNSEETEEATADEIEESAKDETTPEDSEENTEASNTEVAEETSTDVDATTSEEDTTTQETSEETTSENAEDATNSDSTENTASNNNSNERVITVEYSGGNRKAVDFRYGPWIYSHPDEEGIVGTVGTDSSSQLTIYAQEAELKAPEDVLIATAGERIANFTGGVRVARKRLTALGEALEYSEETGFGELSAQEQVEITVLPKENDGDLTEIKATSATFDVDTDISVSRGNVTLNSGSQSAAAEELTFEQGLDLAVMTSPEDQVTVTRSNDDGELIITADTIRVLSESKKLMASGNVKLVDGAITTTGEVVFFDDEIERAEVFGTPDNLAVSIDSEFDVTLKGERLEQLIDLDLVEILDETVPSIWDEADFLLTSETNN